MFCLLLLPLSQERDEWVAELRVASRVVPLEEHFEVRALLRKGAFASVSQGKHFANGLLLLLFCMFVFMLAQVCLEVADSIKRY